VLKKQIVLKQLALLKTKFAPLLIVVFPRSCFVSSLKTFVQTNTC